MTLRFEEGGGGLAERRHRKVSPMKTEPKEAGRVSWGVRRKGEVGSAEGWEKVGGKGEEVMGAGWCSARVGRERLRCYVSSRALPSRVLVP